VLLFSTVVRHCLALLSDGWQACVGSSPGGTRQAELWGLLRQRFSSQRSRMMARCEATGWGRAVRSPLVSQLGLVCPGGVALTELLLVATPTGEDILGIIKHRGKSLPDSFCQCRQYRHLWSVDFLVECAVVMLHNFYGRSSR
jgi:hypothetical protein